MQLTKLRGGLFPRYRLDEDYEYNFRFNGNPARFTIPAGYIWDGASFGSFLFWRKSMHTSPHTLAHDWTYDMRGHVKAFLVDKSGKPSAASFSLTKKDADDNFLQGARRDENIQNWRTYVASGVFKTIAHLYWNT